MTSPRLSNIQDCYPRRDPQPCLGRTPAAAAKAGVRGGREQRQLVPGHGRGAVGREPGRYIAWVHVSKGRLCWESGDWARLGGWVDTDRRRQTEDCLLGWRYRWRLQKGRRREVPRGAELVPNGFIPFVLSAAAGWGHSPFLFLSAFVVKWHLWLQTGQGQSRLCDYFLPRAGQVSITECKTGAVLRLCKVTNTGMMKDPQPPVAEELLCFC